MAINLDVLSRRCLLTTMVLGFAASGAFAATISANFCSVANVENPPAGINEAMTWNDLTSAAGFGGVDSTSALTYENGDPAGVTVSWGGSSGVSQNTNDNVLRPDDIDDGHDEMMAGYLQASKFGTGNYVPTIQLEVLDIDVDAFGGSYDVILYFDGNGDVEGTAASVQFLIDDGVFAPPALHGQDAGDQYALLNDGADPLSIYNEITSTDPLNPSVGNYVVFSGLTGTGFVATLTGVANEHGVALNGFQIVPEPTAGVLALAGMLLFRRHR